MINASLLRKIAIAGFVLATAACDSAEERAEKHYERGMAFLEQDDDVKANLEFRNALQLVGGHAPARLQMAKMAEEDANFRGAFRNYERVIAVEPENVEARLGAARIAMAGGEAERARAHIEVAYGVAPENVDVLATRALIDYSLGDQARAIENAQAALAIDPDMIGAHMVVIRDVNDREGADAALAAMDALLERFPEDMTLNLAKLQLLGASNDEAAIEAHLIRLTSLYPETPSYRRTLAMLYIRRGDVAAAEEQLRAIAALDPTDTDAALEVVRLVIADRGRAAGETELRSLIDAAPDDEPRAIYTIALSGLMLAEGDQDGARVLLQALVDETTSENAADRARIRLAQMALRDGDADAASQLVETVLARDADNVEAIALRASMMIDALDLDAGILEVRRGLNLAPENAQLMLLEALAHERGGSLELAGDRLAAATRATDFAPEVTLRYAAFLSGRGQHSGAATALDEAVRRSPTDQRLLLALAEARLRSGDTAGAEAVVAQLRQLEGGGALADRVRAATLLQEGRVDESEAMLQGLVADDVVGGNALSSLVTAYVARGDIDKAQTLIDNALEENPDNIQALARRAELQLRTGDAVAAESTLEQIIESAPNAAAGYMMSARLNIGLGRPEKAEELVRAGLEAAPEASTLRFLMASLLESRGAFNEAIAEYETVHRAEPDSLVAANNLASLLAEFRADDAEALAYASRVARRLRNSDIPQFQDTYGWIAFLNGDMGEALRVLRPAAEALPDNPLVVYHLGRAYAEVGETALAREMLDAALALDPDFPKAASAQAALDALSADAPEASGG